MRQSPFNGHPSFGHNKRGLLQHDLAVHLAADMDFARPSPLSTWSIHLLAARSHCEAQCLQMSSGLQASQGPHRVPCHLSSPLTSPGYLTMLFTRLPVDISQMASSPPCSCLPFLSSYSRPKYLRDPRSSYRTLPDLLHTLSGSSTPLGPVIIFVHPAYP